MIQFIHSLIWLSSISLTMLFLPLDARIDFGSRESMLSFASGTLFGVNSANLSIPGTLKMEDGVTIDGSEFSFEDGLLVVGASQSTFTGFYDPSGSDTIRLDGDCSFNARPGEVVKAVVVSDTGNELSGQPTFSSSITLQDEDTELAIAIQTKLNQDIILNDGTLTLNDDLSLADNVKLAGDGIVNLNNCHLNLGGFYTTAWSGNLDFVDALGITLNGSILLTGQWLFEGTCVINGNGCIIDVSDGGRIRIAAGSTLILNDVIIKGLGSDDGGAVVFNSTTSNLRSTNSQFIFDGNVTFDRGDFEVFGSTTFGVGSHVCMFSDDSLLTVDAAVLTVDFLGAGESAGGVFAPLDILDEANTASNLNLNVENGGVVRAATGGTTGGSSSDPGAVILLSGNVTTNVSLQKELFLAPDQTIRINENITLNGRGNRIHFSGDKPQLIIAPGKSLTLKNVTFDNLTQNSIDIRLSNVPNSAASRYATGSIKISNDVSWVLDSSITFSNGRIVVLPTDLGYNIFKMRSNTTRQSFSIAPIDIDADSTTQERAAHTGNNAIIHLGNSTLQLESIRFDGLEFVGADYANPLASPAIALSGNAAADVGSYKIFGQSASIALTPFNTAMNFFIEGPQNDLVMTNDSNELSGAIVFGDQATNELRFGFNYTPNIPARTIIQTERFATGQQGQIAINTRRATVPAKVPLVVFAGDPGMFVSSQQGTASLLFNSFECAVQNKTDNAFILDNNGSILYTTLHLFDFPVKQQSTNSRYFGHGNLKGSSFFDTSFAARTGTRSLRALSKKPCALQLMRQKNRDQHKKIVAEGRKRAAAKSTAPLAALSTSASTHKQNKKAASKKAPHKFGAEQIDQLNNALEQSSSQQISVALDEQILFEQDQTNNRAFALPQDPDGLYIVDSVETTDAALMRGTFIFKGDADVSNAIFDETGFECYMTEGVTLRTKPITETLQVDDAHKFFIDVTNNEVFNYLVVNGPMIIDGAGLEFNPAVIADDGQTILQRAQFEINIPDENTSIILNGELTLPRGTNLVLRGKGTVFFGAGLRINFDVYDDESIVPLDNLPVINIADSVKVVMQESAEFAQPVQTYGRGYIRLLDKATFRLYRNALYVGLEDSENPANPQEYTQHELTIDIESSQASLWIGNDTEEAAGLLCSRYATFNMINAGSLYVQNNGTWIVNTAANESFAAPGHFKEFTCSEGARFDLQGRCVWGDNIRLAGGTQRRPIDVNFTRLGLSTGGQISYKNADTLGVPFTAPVVSQQGLVLHAQLTVKDLASRLVAGGASTLAGGFVRNTVFQNADGTWTVITSDGITVNLGANEYPTFEDDEGRVHGDTSTTNINFVIDTAAGQIQYSNNTTKPISA